MQDYGIKITLLFSKYSSPTFAPRQLNGHGQLSFSVDLRRTNHLIKHDYGDHNHPVTTFSDAAQHLAGRKHFCQLSCCQVYRCIQMVDEQSVQLHFFKFGSRTFACKRLTHGLGRSLSAFIGIIRDLDTVLKANLCAQYVDDIGVAAHTASELIENVDIVFKEIQKPSLKLSSEKCQFA